MERRECPFCGERIQRDALKCRYCREWLSEMEQVTIQEKEILVEQTSPIDSEKEKKEETTPISIEHNTLIISEEREIETEEDIVVQTQDTQPQDKIISLSKEEEEEVIAESELIEIIEIDKTTEDLEFETVPEIQIPTQEGTSTFTSPEEEEEEQELIRWQNFKTNKILAILAFILSCVAAYFSYIEAYDELTIRSIFWVFITIALETYLCYQLYSYLSNFDVFYELQNTMKFLLGCYILSLIGIALFFAAYHYANMVWLIIPLLSIASIVILGLIVSWKLWKRTDDFVGGLNSFGQFTFISFFIPGIGILSPLFLYKVFANAQEHIEDNGYLDDNEDDY